MPGSHPDRVYTVDFLPDCIAFYQHFGVVWNPRGLAWAFPQLEASVWGSFAKGIAKQCSHLSIKKKKNMPVSWYSGFIGVLKSVFNVVQTGFISFNGVYSNFKVIEKRKWGCFRALEKSNFCCIRQNERMSQGLLRLSSHEKEELKKPQQWSILEVTPKYTGRKVHISALPRTVWP